MAKELYLLTTCAKHQIWVVNTEVFGELVLKIDLPIDTSRAIEIIKIIAPRCRTLVDLKYDFIIRYGKLLSSNNSTG